MTVSMQKRLTEKLSRIRAGAYTPRDFIIADAKDAEMGGGIGALGALRLADGPRGRPIRRITGSR